MNFIQFFTNFSKDLEMFETVSFDNSIPYTRKQRSYYFIVIFSLKYIGLDLKISMKMFFQHLLLSMELI